MLIALAAVFCFSVSARAGDSKGGSKKDGGKAAAGEHKDPKGITGISPFMELVNKGNAAYVARDFATAATTYQEAIQKEPNRALGHYLLGEAYLAAGKMEEANSAWDTALRYVSKDAVMKAKVLFVIADLRERQQRYDDAANAWKEYASFVTENQNAKGYAGTPAERQRAIEKRKDLAEKYSKVKERIEQREKDAAAKATN
jgi:tetratricopeptide (TPR) repeat protein